MTKTTPGSVPARGRLTSAGSASGRITELYTLGGVRVLCEGVDETTKLGPRHVALLVFLYHEARPLQPSELVELLGRGQEEDKELERLHKAINWLRNNVTGVDISFNADTIETYGGVRLDTREVDAAIDGRDPEHVAALYKGEFLDGFESGAPNFDEWAQRERGRLQRAWGNAIVTRARDAERRRDWDAASLWWKIIVAASPTRADAVAGLLSAHAHAARWAEAAGTLENYNALLKGAGLSKIPQPVGRVIAAHPRLTEIARRRDASDGGGSKHAEGPAAKPDSTASITEDSAPDDVSADRTSELESASEEGKNGSAPQMPLATLDDTEVIIEARKRPHTTGAAGRSATKEGKRGDDEEVAGAEREPWKEFLELPDAGDTEIAPPIAAPRAPRTDDDDEHTFGRPGGKQSDLWGPADPLEEARAAARTYLSISGGGSTRVKHEITSVRKPWKPALESAWHELRPWLAMTGAAVLRGLAAAVRLGLEVPAAAGLGFTAALRWVRRTASAMRSAIASVAERRREAKRERAAERARKMAQVRAAAAARKRSTAANAHVGETRSPFHPQPAEAAPSVVRGEPPVPGGPRTPPPGPHSAWQVETVPEPDTADEPETSGNLSAVKDLDGAIAPAGDAGAILDTVEVGGPAMIEDVVAEEEAAPLAEPEPEVTEWVEEPKWVESVEETRSARRATSWAPSTRRPAARVLARTGESLARVRGSMDWSRASGLLRRYWFAPLGVALLLAAILLGPGIVARIRGVSQNLRADLPQVHATVPRVALPKVVVPRVAVPTPAFVETSVSKIGAMLSGAILSGSGRWVLVADLQFQSPQSPPSDVAAAAAIPTAGEGTPPAVEERAMRASVDDPPARSGRRRGPDEVLPGDGNWSPLAAALTTALEADMGEARYYSVVPRERALSALAEIRGTSGQRLPLQTALALATAENYAVVIAAYIRQRSAGPDSVQIQVLSASGDTLYGVAAEVTGDMSLLETLSGLSRAVRRRLGEPATDVVASPPSTQLLTSSLPALEAYAEARTHLFANRYSQAIAAAREAIARDSTFAMSYRTLAEAYALQGLRPRARAALETAWELSGRLDERERYRLLADRLAWDGHYSDAALTYDELFKRYRDDAGALRCLALVQRTIGVRGGGEGNLSVAYAIDRHDWPRLSHLARYLGYSGPLPDVDSLVAAMDTLPGVTE